MTAPSNYDPTAGRTPEQGCDRCPCGCKYWEGDRCVDCGDRFRPWADGEFEPPTAEELAAWEDEAMAMLADARRDAAAERRAWGDA